ncbi:MAG: hypothetical protein ABI758_03075 [Candidatus Woesebacteria bacterium]
MEKLYNFSTLEETRQQEIRNKIRDEKTPVKELIDLADLYVLPSDITAELNNALKAKRHEGRVKSAGDKLWSSTNRY